MKMKKLLALLLAAMLCMTMFSAVAETAETVDTAAETTEDAPVLIATVNGIPVTNVDVATYLSNLNNYYSQQGYDVTDPDNAAVIEEMALSGSIQMAVMQSKAAELGFDKMTDEEVAQVTADVDAEWEEALTLYASYFGADENSDEATLAAARTQALALLEGVGYTKETLLASALDNYWYEKLTAYIVKDAQVTDADVEAAFAERVESDKAQYEGNVFMYEYYTQYMGYESFYTPEGYRGIRHILLNVDEELMNNYSTLAAQLEEQMEAVESGDETAAADETAAPVTQADVDAAEAAILASVQPTVDEIMQKLADGVSFSDLIAEYGNDPGMTMEPQKTSGYNVHIESIIWDPAFTKGAFSMDKVGDVSAPVVGSYGVHILEYTRDVPAGAVELTDEIRASMMDELVGNIEAQLFNDQMDIWMNEAEIVMAE